MTETLKLKILKSIVEEIKKDNSINTGPGLLTGKSGIALLLFYYSRYLKNNEYSKVGVNIILEVFESIKQGYNFSTFSDGICGFSWLVEHLAQNNFISRSDVPFLQELDDVLHTQMIHFIRSGEYDYLHGSIGIGNYFISRLEENPHVEKYIIDLVNELEIQGNKSSAGKINWTTVSDLETNSIGCNLGLAHGMSSIIIFLANVVNKLNYNKANILLSESMSFLLSQQLDKDKYGINFPNVIFNENILTINRKIGWCHGDTGTGVAIYKAGTLVQNKNWINLGIKILLDTTNIKDLKYADIRDPGICHGTSGLAHIYGWLHSKTDISTFKDASNYWLKETIEMRKFKRGLKEFDKWYPGEENFKQKNGILLGLSGIGLVILSDITNNYSWNKCLLLS